MDYGFVKLIRFDSSGNVGIGTNRPQAKLNIHGNVDISGNLLPTQNITHDIGSSTKRWRDIYLSGNTIDLGGTLIQKEESGGIKIADSSGNTLDGTFQNITINGIINQSTQLDVSGSIVPTRDITYDLGSVTKRWRDIYLSGNTIDISGTRISRHTNGNMMVHDVQGNILGVTMDHIDLSGTVIRKHVDGSVAFTDVSSNRVIGRFGDIDVSGNVSATGNVTSNNIQCQNLTVNGTTTTINSTTVTVQDPIITLGSDITNTKDKGIEFKYGDSKIGFFGYNDSTGNLTFLKDASNNSEVFTGTQGTIEGLTFKSTILNGTAPLTVTSSTLVTNLNADLLDGLNNDKFMRTDISTSSTGSITSSSTITGTRLVSTVPFGTAPLSVTSSTLVTNLNSMLFYGLGSTQFMRSDINTSTTGTITIGGNVGIGTSNPQAVLHIASTGAMIIPAGTTAQQPSAPVTGMLRYNTTTNKLQYYNPIGWNSIGAVSAIGGNTTTDLNGYRIHIFTSSSNFTIYMGGVVEILVVAAGGGGGCRFGGGGGAGGLIYNSTFTAASGTFTITVGSGGAGGPTNNTRGSSGNNSSFDSLINAIGGGGGASESESALAGGSGGGGSYATITAGTGTSGQGFNGGTGQASIRVNGGGGGAAELGKGSGNRPDGGNGLQYSISGTATYYAGGGGGADNRVDSAGFGGPTAGNGGLGGGGQGGGGESNGQADARSGTGVSGTTNTGGGGGGGSYIPSLPGGRPGGAGGSGIVIIRYPL